MKYIKWKIKRDPFYAELHKKHGFDYIVNAGFFNDTATEDVNVLHSVNVLCTPLNGLKEKLKATKNCVILSTGAFAPIHAGHINMMDLAKEAVEKAGWNCIGGYISPGHDEYISEKNGKEAIPIHYRIQLINDAIKDIEWLKVDPWEGIFNNVSVNFTDVIYRLENYLQKHLGVDIKVFFVCGSDNIRFIDTFKNHGHCVVIKRPGITNSLTYWNKITALPSKQDRILYALGTVQLSSTQVRKEMIWKTPKKKILHLRTENHVDENILINILKKYYTKVIEHNVVHQIEQFEKFGYYTISLDAAIKSKFNLKISRSYDLYGTDMHGYVNRPNTPPLITQIKRIPKNNAYTLFDDDIHTGNTMRYVKALLEEHKINIEQITSLNISTPENAEILDARDFFFGNDDNGLVIELPNKKHCRVPYVYPFVDPSTRCSISNPLQFSIDIWKMNLDYFLKNKKYTLDMFPDHWELFKYLGFKKSDTVLKFCNHYYRLLLKIQKK